MKFNRLIFLLIIFIIFPYRCVTANPNNQNTLNIYSNSEEQLFPASTTKILTAIITLEKCDLNSVVTVSRSAVLSVPSRIFFCLFIRRRTNNSRWFVKIASCSLS